MMVSQGDEDDFCPHCGVPVPGRRRGPRCPFCDGLLELPEEGPATTGYLTVFGYGMCGLTIGGQVGVSAALVSGDPGVADPRLPLYPLLVGVVLAVGAAWVGARLDWAVRRGYEILLLGGIAGSTTALLLALVGVQSPEALVCVGLGATNLAIPLIRRYAYPRQRAG